VVKVDDDAILPAPGHRATYFDGRSNAAQPVQVRVDAGTLEITTDVDDGQPRRYAVDRVAPGERYAGAPLPVALPDGGTLWLDDEAAPVAAALAARADRRRPAARLSASWRAVVACLVALVGLVVWFDRQGAGLAADAALVLVPRRVDDAVGAVAMRAIDKRWLAPSTMDVERRGLVTTRLLALQGRVAPELEGVRIEFRRLLSDTRSEAGFNAFALPDGTIVLLDGLAEALTDDELLAVLAHELGHVAHRHGMRSALRGFGLAAVAGAVLGDFSGVVAAGVATLQTFHHSRDAEREADAFMHRAVAAEGLPPQVIASVWRKFAAREQREGGGGLPAWMSTHPPTDERLRAAVGR
jgi:Zn-dependent protease with chaperone function